MAPTNPLAPRADRTGSRGAVPAGTTTTWCSRPWVTSNSSSARCSRSSSGSRRAPTNTPPPRHRPLTQGAPRDWRPSTTRARVPIPAPVKTPTALLTLINSRRLIACSTTRPLRTTSTSSVWTMRWPRAPRAWWVEEAALAIWPATW